MDKIVLNPLIWAQGKENMGGYTGRLAYIPDAWVKKAPRIPNLEKATEITDLATASGSFEFIEAGKKPVFIYASDKTVSFTSENQGEVDGRSFNQKASFNHPGASVENAAFARLVNNLPGYLILEETDGTQRLMGQPGLLVSLAPSFAGGQARPDKKGTTYNAECDSFVPYAVLASPIEMDALEAAAKGATDTTP